MSAQNIARVFLAVLALIFPTGKIVAGEKPFCIEVVDAATGRGVPMVELETMDNVLRVTDSAGRVAFDGPGQMGCRCGSRCARTGMSFHWMDSG